MRSRTQVLWLLMQLAIRDIGQRHRGTMLGLALPVLFGLLQLGVYTFVFSYVMRVRWPNIADDAQTQDVSLILFAGLIPFFLVSEVINRAPSLIVTNPNLVKKIPFPLILLPVVSLISASFHLIINLGVLLCFSLLFWGGIPWTALLLPLAYLPLLFLCLGLAWIISAFGVFLRDLSAMIPIVSQLLLFATPIFYPVQIIPAPFDRIIMLNPLTPVVGYFRDLLVFGKVPDLLDWGVTAASFGVFAAVGLWFFNRLRPAFSDIV